MTFANFLWRGLCLAKCQPKRRKALLLGNARLLLPCIRVPDFQRVAWKLPPGIRGQPFAVPAENRAAYGRIGQGPNLFQGCNVPDAQFPGSGGEQLTGAAEWYSLHGGLSVESR